MRGVYTSFLVKTFCSAAVLLSGILSRPPQDVFKMDEDSKTLEI